MVFIHIPDITINKKDRYRARANGHAQLKQNKHFVPQNATIALSPLLIRVRLDVCITC